MFFLKINKSSLLYGTLFLTTVNLVSQTLAFFYRVSITYLIGAENMGLYQLLMPAYFVITSFCYSGLTVAVSRLVSEHIALKRQNELKGVLSNALTVFIVVSIAVSVIIFIFSNKLSSGFIGDARTEAALIILLPCMILTGIENISKNYFYGLNDVKIPAIMEIFEQIIRISAVISLLLIFSPTNGETALSLIAVGMVICEIFSAVALTVLRIRHINKLTAGYVPDKKQKKHYKQIFSIAIPVCFTNLSGALMDSVNSSIIPKRLVASGVAPTDALEDFGRLFGMSMPLISLPTVFIGALCLIIVPSLSKLFSLGKIKELQAKISKIISVSMLVTLPIMAFFVPIGPYVAEIIYGDKAVGENLGLLAVATVLSVLQAITCSVAYSLGKERPATLSFVAGDYIQVLFTYFLVAIPSLRLNGFVIGLIVSTAVTAVTNVIIILKASAMRLKVFNWFLAPLTASLAVFIVSRLAVSFFEAANYAMMPAILGIGIFSAVLYLAMINFFRRLNLHRGF